MIELINAVLYEKESKTEVTVRDAKGRIRRITLSMHSKDGMVLPENWVELVQGEIDYQDSQQGRYLPGRDG